MQKEGGYHQTGEPMARTPRRKKNNAQKLKETEPTWRHLLSYPCVNFARFASKQKMGFKRGTCFHFGTEEEILRIPCWSCRLPTTRPGHQKGEETEGNFPELHARFEADQNKSDIVHSMIFAGWWQNPMQKEGGYHQTGEPMARTPCRKKTTCKNSRKRSRRGGICYLIRA